MNDHRDPFAEKEVVYTGPASEPDTVDDAFEDIYATDDGSDAGEFIFDTEDPNDWSPPIPPTSSTQGSFADDTPAGTSPPRPAPQVSKPAGPGDLLFSADLVLTPQATPVAPTPAVTPAPVVKPQSTPRKAPEVRTVAHAPEVGKTPRKTLGQRFKSLFVKDEVGSSQNLHALQRSLSGSVNIVMINRKGGVGKTLVTTLAGMMLASHRKDRVIAVDASPEGGELGDRVEREQNGTVGSLLDQLEAVSRYSHVRTHTSQDHSGLEVLASEPQKPISSGEEYHQLMAVLRQYYPVILTDCAQGLKSELMESVLEEADVLVLVSEGTDGMKAATQVANDLVDAQGIFGDRFAHLVDDMVVVVNHRSPKTNVDTSQVVDFFTGVAREVVSLPYDQMFEGGRAFTLDELSAETRAAGVDLATAIVNSTGFMDGGR